ncbi:SIR2-like domain protein [Neorhizobium galegae bv. officinalis]|uniref:SIR2-like domain protein n=1 Tax=Neorhizobium galegae bv. officinalis TaxID=323656 RepID=A0A0T7FKM8_NEOGA|nr:SIR2 family protein [Neorhizobium galegae]CDZ35567.1 SIR2-like domain protein [Neorhizobium galegae bv. officinalis]
MKIKTSQQSGKWIEVQPPGQDGLPDPATTEIRRVLSSAVGSQNLIVLTGLGTSLCVMDAVKKAAPTMWDLLTAIKDRFDADDGVDLEPAGTRWSDFERLANVPAGTQDLEYLMSRATVAAEFLSGNDAKKIKALLEIAEGIIREQVGFMKDSIAVPVHEAFLRRVARRSARRARTRIFTTNYDTCFEVAGRRSGFIIVDGFAFGSDAIFDSAQFSYDVVRRAPGEERSDFIENLFQLYKIHGSVDWEFNPATNQIAKRPGTAKPLLIYPRSTKYEMAFSQPYIEMMGTFQSSLRTPNTTLVIIGFGFNDKHIAEPILAAMKGNLSLNAVIINPDLEKTSVAGGNPYLSSVANLIENGDARLSLIAAKFEDVVPVIPDAIAETELERHSQRIRSMGQPNV